MSDDFLYRDVPSFGRRMFRLGLATNYGVDGQDLEWALDQGVNYVFWTPSPGARRVTKSLKKIINRDRKSVILASGPTTGYFGGSIKRACERLLEKLGTDYLDVFQLFWLGRGSAWSASTIKALVSLRKSGMVRAIGVSIHNRKRAGKLAEDSPLDMLMIRYNAAHPGVETGDEKFAKQTARRWGESKLDSPFARVELHQGILDPPDLDSDIFNGVRVWELPF